MDNPERSLPPGKLPAALLGDLIRRYVRPDPSVVVGPGTGRDAAVIDLGDRLLVVKTDPVTFATEDAGRYLVNVNANDIICMGATPRWLLVTALLPERLTTPSLVESIFSSLADAAGGLGIALVGGHSEITIGLERPILIGQMIGECARETLIDVSRVASGDAIVLSGGIAIEGSALLAIEAPEALDDLDRGILERARRFLSDPGISVAPAAAVLRRSGIDVRYLHDPTEGGIATALAELSTAANCRVEVQANAIPILEETRLICGLLDVDPLGLIASGALLAVVAGVHGSAAAAELRRAGMVAEVIGRVVEGEPGVWSVDEHEPRPFPTFEVDEIARYFASRRNNDADATRHPA